MTFRNLSLTKLLFVCLSLALPALSAHATPITAGVYQATGITISGTSDTLTGTVTFDGNGALIGANLTLNDSVLGNPVYSLIGSTGTCCSPVDDFAFIGVTGNKGQLELIFSPTLTANGDIDLCVVNSGCNQASNIQYYYPNFGPASFASGTFAPAATAQSSIAPAPEPSSLILLGTGLFGVVASARLRSYVA